MLEQSVQLLRAIIGFAGGSMPSYDRSRWALRTWLDSGLPRSWIYYCEQQD